jgi:hypothetical protein
MGGASSSRNPRMSIRAMLFSAAATVVGIYVYDRFLKGKF